MEMEDYDKNKLYEVYDEEKQQIENSSSKRPLTYASEQIISKKGCGLTILSVLLLLMFLVIIILQVVTIAHLNLFPVVCPDSETASSNTNTINYY